jgi:hypothetical protein
MPVLVWDEVGERHYETGLDRGVLYLPDGSAVPWNGLTSVIEAFDKETAKVYYDGMKISDFISLGDFKADLKAVTYPDEFVEFDGFSEVKTGIFYADQRPKTFGLCYRTQIGNDLVGDVSGYKIHLIYNVVAVPKEKTYATLTADPSLVEFEWEISAIPEEVPGFAPTAHLIIDTTKVDPWLLEEIEEILYGNTLAIASLIPMQDLIELISNWFRVKIIDNGDGTWTAEAERDGFIFVTGSYFEIIGVNAVYLDDVTFIISDTDSVRDVPQIKINDNKNGTWTATSDHSALIVEVDPGEVEIRNANIDVINSTTYRISDTTAED